MPTKDLCPRFPAAPLEELQPLLAELKRDRAPAEDLTFTRGTLAADGRLDLCKQGLGQSGTSAVSRALENNTKVTSLLLGADSLGDEGAAEVASLLKVNKTLSTVFLGCNGIRAKGAAALAESLIDNQSVRGLWLKRNPIGVEGARCLAQLLKQNTTLRTLDLVQTGIGAAGLEAIVQALCESQTSVERLYLGGNDFGPEEAQLLARLISGCSSLKEIELGCSLLGDQGVTTIAGSLAGGEMTALGLASNGLTSVGLQVLLEHAAGLNKLNLGYSPSTVIMGVAPNRIEDQGAELLAAWLTAIKPKLERLDICENGLTILGVRKLIEAASEAPRLAEVRFGLALPKRMKAALASALEGKRLSRASEDVLAIRSFTRNPQRGKKPPQILHEEPPAHLDDVSSEELALASRVLEILAKRPELFWSREHPELRPVRASANRLIESIKRESSERKGLRPNRLHDRRLLRATQIHRPPAPEAPSAPKPASIGRLHRGRGCYVCKEPYNEVHFFYPDLCPKCAQLNYAKRGQRADLSGRTALLTGGRVKIGHQAALKLLRCGARVIVTSRFPADAARRFSRHDDFAEWGHNLQLVGLDLRDLRAVEQFAGNLLGEGQHLDILVNNAAQTIRRPPSYFAPLLKGENCNSLDSSLRALISPLTYQLHQAPGGHTTPAALLSQKDFGSEQLSLEGLLPAEFEGSDGVPLDFRSNNSWKLTVEQVSGGELLEVHLVNAIAPFLLLKHLKPALLASPHQRRFVVNVSAMEGSFSYHFKGGTHPHTNMAKAALNMLTRTSGQQFAKEGVYMTSVDTGWVTNENPYPVAAAMEEQNFSPPLDLVDGAARVCDPVLSGLGEKEPVSGCFLKDYRPTEW